MMLTSAMLHLAIRYTRMPILRFVAIGTATNSIKAIKRRRRTPTPLDAPSSGPVTLVY
jgi:hypothetical protein